MARGDQYHGRGNQHASQALSPSCHLHMEYYDLCKVHSYVDHESTHFADVWTLAGVSTDRAAIESSWHGSCMHLTVPCSES